MARGPVGAGSILCQVCRWEASSEWTHRFRRYEDTLDVPSNPYHAIWLARPPMPRPIRGSLRALAARNLHEGIHLTDVSVRCA